LHGLHTPNLLKIKRYMTAWFTWKYTASDGYNGIQFAEFLKGLE